MLGSGGSVVATGVTGCDAVPAAHGFGCTAATPAERKALVPLAPHDIARWPDSSEPSAHTALVDPEFDPAELTNAVDQARREVSTRFDFKDTATAYDNRGDVIVIESASEDRARAALQVLREKAARRQLSPKLFKAGDPKTIGRGRGQIEVNLNAGITDDLARDLRKRIQNVSPKLQVRIQGDQLRVTSKDKDTLQLVIKALREAEDIPVPLQFTNYR